MPISTPRSQSFCAHLLILMQNTIGCTVVGELIPAKASSADVADDLMIDKTARHGVDGRYGFEE